ncbi:MAG: hypothetical protein RQ752_07425 [Thermohalobaculum sp.]|nr:hypothetical protein [Thermohalobaculum sp.]
MHPLLRQIDGYCERVGAAFWAEPLNAVTNIAFIVAGLAAIAMARRMGRLDGPVMFLTANAIVVGIGSFLFHTFATVWAAMADTGPILVFILAYFTIAMRAYVGLGWGRAVLVMLGFLVAMFAVAAGLREVLLPVMGRSVSYVPALMALGGIGLWLQARGHAAGAGLLLGAGVFAASLTFRTLDGPVCGVWPVGTHFLWHLMNGLLLWLLILTLIRHGRAPLRRLQPA